MSEREKYPEHDRNEDQDDVFSSESSQKIEESKAISTEKDEESDIIKELDEKSKQWKNSNISDEEKRKSLVLQRREKIEHRIEADLNTNLGKAVQLYKYDGNDYYLDRDVMRSVFGKVENKLVAIYCIAGKYRSGKSFMLAQFLKYLMYGTMKNWIDIQTTETFKYQNCDERVTTGIWIWPDPFIRQNRDGRDVAVFLMDTQGWHDDKTSSKNNAMVFALSALLSSVMIFNVDRLIGEDDLQYFQCFTSTAKLIDPENKDEPFQKLVLLVRDWQFKKDFPFGYYDDKTSINGKNYKTSKLNPKPDQNIEAKSIREIIQSTYPDIGAYLMPRPGNWIYDDEEFSTEVNDPLFVRHVMEFTKLTFSINNIMAKKIGGKYITGKELIRISDDWAQEFNYMPSVSKYKPAIVQQPKDETYYLLAYQTALDYFDEKMKAKMAKCEVIGDYQKLKDNQEKVIKQSKSIFYAGSKMDNETIKNRYQRKLHGELDDRMNIYSKIIDKKIQLQVIMNEREEKTRILEKVSEEIARASESEASIHEELERDINIIKEKEKEEKQLFEGKVSDLQDIRRNNRKSWFSTIAGVVSKLPSQAGWLFGIK